MAKSKVLIICPSNKGTIALCTLNLWKALNQSGYYETKCILLHKMADGITDFDGCESLFHGTPVKGLKRLLSAKKELEWIKTQKKKFNPSQTISTLFNCSALNVLAGGQDVKTGIFHSPHFQAKVLGRVSYLTTLIYYKFLFPHLDRLFCVSKEVEDSILKSFPKINPAKISVVYNAHDIDAIRQKSKEDIKDPMESKIFEDDVIIYVGRFDKNKAPERALKAFADSDIKPNSRLVYIGGNEQYADELKKLANDLGVMDRTHFLGQKQNPYKYISRAKTLVSCSYSEGLPGVIIEALILGVPVISTNSSQGVWEILSCHKDYGQITENYVCSGGVITPNTNTMLDIKCLSEAMSHILSKSLKNFNFPFISEIQFEAIAKKLQFN